VSSSAWTLNRSRASRGAVGAGGTDPAGGSGITVVLDDAVDVGVVAGPVGRDVEQGAFAVMSEPRGRQSWVVGKELPQCWDIPCANRLDGRIFDGWGPRTAASRHENCCSRMILPALTVIRVALDWSSLASPVVVGKTTTTPSPSRSIRLGWAVVRACAAPA
jgi:hypothetical protein